MQRAMGLIEKVTELVGSLLGWLLFLVGLMITYEVVMRYVFVRPTIWVGEVTLQIQIWAVFLGAAYVLKHRDMVTIEVILNDHRSVLRKVAETFALFFLFVFTVPAIWYGLEIWARSAAAGHTTDSFLALPRWFTDASVWLGFSLLSLQAVVELWKIWTIGIPESKNDPLEALH